MTTASATKPPKPAQLAAARARRSRAQPPAQPQSWLALVAALTPADIRTWTGTPPSAKAPEDWGASGTGLRLAASCIRRFAGPLGGDLTDEAVRHDLACAVAYLVGMLVWGDELIAEHAATHTAYRAGKAKRERKGEGA